MLESQDDHEKKLEDISKLALTDMGSAIWTDVQPKLTGLPFTFWVSMESEYPYVIVDPTPGSKMLPTSSCQAFEYDKIRKYPQVQNWVNKHKNILYRLMNDHIGCGEFYRTISNDLNLDDSQYIH